MAVGYWLVPAAGVAAALARALPRGDNPAALDNAVRWSLDGTQAIVALKVGPTAPLLLGATPLGDNFAALAYLAAHRAAWYAAPVL